MSKSMRIAVLAMSLVSLFAVLPSAAGATTWTNTGQTTFSATAGPGSLSATGTTLSCAMFDATGATSTPVAGSPVIAKVASGTITCTNARMAGTVPTVDCAYALTAERFAAGVTTGNADITCGVYLAGREICHIEGATAITYTNGAAGVLGLPHSNTLVTTRGSGGGSCPLGNDDRLTLTSLSFRVTTGTGPVFALDS